MGRGSSGLKGGGGGGRKANSTPSGVTYAQFMSMTEDQRSDVIEDILNDDTITVPAYLDDSETTKVIYALGMATKPTVVSDSQLDSMPGEEIFRTVSDVSSPPPSATDITDQLRNGNFTQMSGSGGSAFGRALYFATDFGESQAYGYGNPSATMARAKIAPGAKIMGETALRNRMKKDPKWKTRASSWDDDGIALYALSHGIDGWKGTGYGKTYRMIVNRGVLTMSSQDKNVSRRSVGGWASAPNK